MADETIDLIEIVGYDSRIAGTRTYRFCTGVGFATGPSETPANTVYEPRILQAAAMKRTAFDQATTTGHSAVGVGDAVLNNADGGLDDLIYVAFDGRSFTHRRGTRNAAYPSGYPIIFVGTVDRVDVDLSQVTVKLRDRQALLDVPYQTTKYAGSNVLPAGLEGVSDLLGKPKPVLLGTVRNIPLPCVNTAKLIYQVNDGAFQSVANVYDKGVALGVSFPLTSRTVPVGHTATTWRDIAYGGGVYVAVGQSTTGIASMRSTDGGTTWAAQTIVANGLILNRVVYAEALALFVAAGQSGGIYHSPDGVTWTVAGTIPAPINAATIASLAWSPLLGLFVAGGAASEFATSTDGNTWTNRVITANSWQIRRAVWGRDRFVLTGFDTTNGVGLIAYSTIGTGSWTQVTSPLGAGSLPCLSYDSIVGRYVAASDGSTNFATSQDAVTWTLRTSDGSTGWQGATTNGGLFVAVNGSNIVGTSYDGVVWTLQTLGLAGSGTLRAVSIVGTKVVIIGINNIWTTADVGTYANSTDLLDDTLAPAPGTYKVYFAGGYVRLGSSPQGTVTADVSQGANAAARTTAQLWKLGPLTRAGLGSSDWSASDIIALDVACPAECGHWSGLNEMTCGAVADLFAEGPNAIWGCDQTGVFRIKQLTPPSTNLVTNPDTLTAAAGWTVTGSVGTTAAFSTVNNVSLTRLTAANTGQVSRPVTLTGNGVKRFTCVVQFDGAAGSTVHGLFDSTAGAYIAEVTIIWLSDGTATATIALGTLVRFAPLAANAYRLVLESSSATAAHSNLAVPLVGGLSTSIRIGRVDVEDAIPDYMIIEDALKAPLERRLANDQDRGIPNYKTIVRYSHNYSPLSGSDLAAGVSDAAKSAFGKEWLEVSAVDTSVQTSNLLAQQRIIESLFAFAADAQTEATRQQAMRGVQREFYEPTLDLDDASAVDLFSLVEIVHSRFGLAGGKYFRPIGIEPDANARSLKLTVWG